MKMKIKYVQGNLIHATEPVIAHGCNAQGKMNSGVAKVIRESFPGVFEAYLEHLVMMDNYDIPRLGTVGKFFYEAKSTVLDHEGLIRPGKFIANCITQEFYGKDGKLYLSYDALKRAMNFLNHRMPMYFGEYCRIAMPKIGSGLAGGDWEQIEEIIETTMTRVQPVVYEL